MGRKRDLYPRNFFDTKLEGAAPNVVEMQPARSARKSSVAPPAPRKSFKILSVEDVARRLNRFSKDGTPNIKYVYELVRYGKLKAFREGHFVRVFEHNLIDYLERLSGEQIADIG